MLYSNIDSRLSSRKAYIYRPVKTKKAEPSPSKPAAAKRENLSITPEK